MIKQFSAGDITVRPFNAFKNWTVQSIDSSSVDKYGYPTYYNNRCEINLGISGSGPFYPSSSQYWISSNEPVNASGKYARNIWSITDGMFYKNADEPNKIFGVEYYTQDPKTGKKEVRKISDRIITLNLKHNVWGEKVLPETVEIVDNSNPNNTLHVFDDGYTNLYVTGAQFPSTEEIGAVREYLATPYWVTSSGQFYVVFNNGVSQSVDLTNARQYMAMGQTVIYVDPDSGSWAWDTSTHQDIFQVDNEHFGEAISTWRNYVAVGSSMDAYSLSDKRIGYASIFKYDENMDAHRLIKKINFPFTQSGATLFEDSFGSSVAIRDNFLAVGSPTGSACDVSKYPGYVCVYDKNKGGPDNWGIINLLRGYSSGDKFGTSVAIDNDILAVGAPGYSSSLGAVHIYRKKRFMDTEYPCQNIDTGSYWQQVVTVEDFCKEMATSSYFATQSYVPTFVSGNYSWTYETTLTSSVGSVGDNFGYCVSVDMDQLIVGTNKTGKGYAALFTCSYYSASAAACPTASWSQVQLFAANTSTGDLDIDRPEYSVDVSNTIATDKYGTSVSISNTNIIVGCQNDKAYIPYYGYTGSAVILGAAYFYHFGYVAECLDYQYHLVTKTFGDRQYLQDNNFARAVSIDGTTAVVSSLPDTLGRNVDFSGSYILENYSYDSTGSTDNVLGRVMIYNYNYTDNQWYRTGELRRNKEENHPYNIYGYAVSVSSDFLAVGGPIVNLATASAYSSIINESSQSLFMPSTYSGSAFIYDVRKYEYNPKIGNVFYKNGYFVITNTGSNYSEMFMGTGSRGFELKYQGAHTIFEHEYLVSVRPGEFNYSTNPSALAQYPMVFDVNQDGVVDTKDVDLVMRFLRMKKFYADFVYDQDGIILEQDTLTDYSWWANDLLQTEAEDVLQQESSYAASMTTSSFDAYTKDAYDYIEANLYNTGILDIDGNGEINLNDGYLFALYVLQRLNPTSIAPYLDANSTRKYVVDIQKYLDKYCGVDIKSTNPEFLNYQYSSSYDATGSFLAPYITTVGLYQDNQLVAVGKLGRPIKNLIDWPVNIVVRFDT
jgi:hypothetical protein